MSHQKPRVLIFSLAYLPLVGGAEIAVKEITNRLGDLFDFDLITLKFNRSYEVTEVMGHEVMGNVNVYRVGGVKWMYPLRAAWLGTKLYRQHKYQVVWSIMAAYAGFAALFFKFLNPQVPFLLTLQEGDSEKHILRRVGILYPLWHLIFKKADHIQAISKYLADFARRHGAVCPIEVIPNGVNLDAYKSYKTHRSNKTYTVITTSRLVYKNGIDTLIRAFSQLPHYLITQLLIVGTGPDRSQLEQLANDLGVSSRVRFVGQIDPSLIPDYLAQADLFVRPSRSEGLGNSFLEAMAAGLPVIGTAVGGIPEFIKGGDTGLFCQVDDPKDLADKIIKVLGDSELFQRLSQNGRKLVEEKYSWNPIAKKMSSIFEKLITKNLKLKTILLATGIYPPEIGGPATYAALLEKELPPRGIGVTVLPFRVVRNWPKGVRHFLYFMKMLRLCRRHNLVLAQDTISVGLPSLLAAKLCRKKFIIRVPGDYVWEQAVQRFGVNDSIDDFQHPNSAPSPDGFGNPKAPIRIKSYPWQVEFLRHVQRFVVGHADAVITPSNYFRDLVRGWVKDRNKVITIYNGIELATSDPTSPRLRWASKRQATSKSKIIISAGRLVPWKGFGFLIELMKDLPEWSLIIAGDGPEREALKSQITNHKLQNRVELVGSVPREKLFEYMRQAEIFVLNTHFESFSFQVVEAMSLGLPVVTTNIGNLSEIVEDRVDGLLVEPNNKKQFLDAIAKLDKDESFRKSINDKARVKAQKFSIENTVNELVGLLKC